MIWDQNNAMMDQGHQSSFGWSAGASSFFSEELRFPTERQVGFSKAESMKDQFGTEGISSLSQNMSVSLSPDEQIHFPGSNYKNGLLLNSLPEFFKGKSTYSSNNVQLGESMGIYSIFGQDEPFKSKEEIEAQTIGNLLPDDDDLLSGVLDNIGYTHQLSSGDDFDDDIFYSGGGIELETDANNIPGFVEGVSNPHQGGLNGTLAGEHPFGEHPSRTLFVRNINSNVEDAELKALFEQFGDIRALYTACKHRGFVMISYYDIRSARNAMRALQNKPLRRRKLDIHYSIPKENQSEKDINQGTLVMFNLDPSVSNDELLQIFGVYGEIKEIRETPHKHRHKFIEFYDVRAAEAALALNRSDIAGKKIKLEPSRAGGARRTLSQQLIPDIVRDELNGGNMVSPNSQGSYFGSVSLGANTSNDLESGAASNLQSAVRATVGPLMDTTIEGISSSLSQNLPSPVRISPVVHRGNQPVSDDLSHLLAQINLGYQGMSSFNPNSLPEYHNGLTDRTPYNSSTMSGLGLNIIRPTETVDSRHLQSLTSGSLNSSAFDDNGGGRHQYSWNNTNAFQHQVPSSIPWSNSPSFMNNITTNQNGLPRQLPHMRNNSVSLHHAGSAPTSNRTLWDRRHACASDATEFHSGSLESMGFPGSRLHHLELASQNIFSRTCGSCSDHSVSPVHVGIPSPQQRCQMFHGRNRVGNLSGSFDSPSDRIRSRRNDSSPNQSDNKKQYELDIDRIGSGDDSRTTLMIKNIPNKYSAEMLLQAIDENHQRTYDFIYLPIDFKNNCNVGYAFINMTSPQHIIPFYQTFNGKKWEKFNSEKVASLAYARIQGKAALVAHFRNSSLMNEDKRCRPILFFSDGPNAGEREPFPTGPNIRSRPGRSRTANGSEEQHQESPSISTPDRQAFCDVLVSPSGSTIDLE